MAVVLAVVVVPAATVLGVGSVLDAAFAGAPVVDGDATAALPPSPGFEVTVLVATHRSPLDVFEHVNLRVPVAVAPALEHEVPTFAFGAAAMAGAANTRQTVTMRKTRLIGRRWSGETRLFTVTMMARSRLGPICALSCGSALPQCVISNDAASNAQTFSGRLLEQHTGRSFH